MSMTWRLSKPQRPGAGTRSDINWRVTGAVILLPLFGLGLSSCAATRMKADFTGFEKAYAETSNREMLLNLARLENRDPTYFFKLGQISTLYKMAASLQGTGNYVNPSMVGGGHATGGGTPNVSYENDPAFTFIPVNDETSAQLLLKPIPAEMFYGLFQQGWRVDQLFRLMVDRIELTRYTPTSCMVEIIRNVPPMNLGRDPQALSTYVTFLRVSAAVYALQKNGNLLLRGHNAFVEYDAKATVKEEPKAADLVSAQTKNAVWEKDGDTWRLGVKVLSPVFYLNPLHLVNGTFVADQDAIKKELLQGPGLGELKNGPALDEAIQILAQGFSVEGAPATQQQYDGPCPPPKDGQSGVISHLVMRSLVGLMAAAAQEQPAFESLIANNPKIPANPHLSEQDRQKLGAEHTFLETVPLIERLPLLKLNWASNSQQTQPLIQVLYRGKNYAIADSPDPENPEDQYWNRDIFRLINQLTAQVTVDISKFPLPEILQLRAQ
jgi:hypothetical protein